MSEVKTAMSEVVATVGKTLYHRPREGSVNQVPLGTVVADAIKYMTKADVAFMNTGGMRKTIKKGRVTKNDVFEALPFDNYVGIMDLTGTDLIKVVETSEKRATVERPQPFLNWSGLKYMKNDGSFSVEINGQPIKSNKIYKVATVDFLANGGDGYNVLKNKDFKTTGRVLRDVFERYIKSNKN